MQTTPGNFSLIVTTPSTGGCYIESGLSEEYAKERMASMRTMFANRNRDDMRNGEQPIVTEIDVLPDDRALVKRDEMQAVRAKASQEAVETDQEL